MYFHIVYQGDGGFVVTIVMSDVIEVDQVGFVGAEEIFAGKAIFDLFQYTGKQVLLSTGGNDPGIPAMSNAAKDLVHPEKLDSPGGLNRYFR